MSYDELRIGRVSRSGNIYHLTIVTNQRQLTFSRDSPAAIVAKELDSAEADGLVRSIAWVLMPDHLHWLVQLKVGSLACLTQRVKGRSAVIINRTRGSTGKVWQRGYHDHAMRRDEELRQMARYIIANPLRVNLVEQVEDYRWWRARWVVGDHGPYDGDNSLWVGFSRPGMVVDKSLQSPAWIMAG